MNCKKCNSTNIKTRTNYSHGKSSKGKKIMNCADCGSSDIQIEVVRKFRRR